MSKDETQSAAGGATRLVLSYEGDERTPVLDAARALASNWKLIFVAVSLGVLAGAVAVILLPPRYTVHAQYVFASDANAPSGMASRLGGLAALAGVNLGGGATTHSEVIAKLRSREFIERFLRDNALLPVIFASKWDRERQTWREEAPNAGDGFRTWSRSIVEVSEDKTSGLLRITVEWTDPEVAAAWCARLVDSVNQEMRNDAIARADASLKYLDDELSRTSNLELRQGLYSLVETTTRERMMAVVSRHFALRPVDPPVAPDKDEEAWPVPIPLIVGGGFAGLFLSIAVLVLVQTARVVFQNRRTAESRV